MKRLLILLLLVSFCFAQSIGTTVSKSVADMKLIEKTEYCSPNACHITFEYCLKVPITTTDKYTWEYLDKNLKSETLNHNLYLLEWQNVSKTRIDYTPYICNITTYDNKTEKNITEEGTCYNAKEVSYSVMEQVEVPFTTFSGCRNITWKGVGLPLGMHDVIPVIDGISYPEFTEIYVSYPYWVDDLNSSIWLRGNATTANDTEFYIYANFSNGTLSSLDDTFLFGDDFNGISLNASRWMNIGGYTVNVSDGAMNFSGSYSAGNGIHGLYNSSYDDIKVIALFRSNFGCSGDCRTGIGFNITNGETYRMLEYQASDSSYIFIVANPVNGTWRYAAASAPNNTLYTLKILNITNYTAYGAEGRLDNANGSQTFIFDGQAYLSAPKKTIYIGVNKGSVDYIAVARYSNPEPVVSCGDIETDSYSVGGGTATSRILCNISTGVNVSDYQFSIPYSLVNDTNLLITNESATDPPNISITNVSIPSTIYPGGYIYCGAVANSTTENVTIQYLWYKNGVAQNISTCYQEQANSGSQCGGIRGGNYSFSDGWETGSTAVTKAFDWDWSTYARSNALPANLTVYYKKPDRAIGAAWMIKDGGGATNLTITADCWDLSSEHLVLEIKSWGSGIVRWYCNDSGGNHELRSDSTNDRVYEEAIIWRFENDTVNTTNNTLTYSSLSNYFNFVMNTGDNITCYARMYNGSDWSDWGTSSTVMVSNQTFNVTSSVYNATRLIGDTMTFYANITNSSGVNGSIAGVEARFYDYYFYNNTWGVYKHVNISNLDMTEWGTGYYYAQTIPTANASNNTIKMFNISYYAFVNYTLPDNKTEIFISNVTNAWYYNYFLCNSSNYSGNYCGNCTNTSCLALSVNISLKNEEEPTLSVTGDTDSNFNLSVGNSSKMFMYSIDNQSSFIYYIWPTWAVLDVTSFEEYTAGGYLTRFHFFNDAEISNAVTNATVYMLNDTLSGYPTTIFVKDTYNNPVPWVYIVVLRYYPETDTYVSVAMTLANEDGEATANLKYTDTWYKFAVYNAEGTSLYVSPSPVTIISDPYPHYTINIESGNISSFDLYEGISYTCEGDWDTTVVTCDYIITSGAWKTVKLIVRESGRWTPICEFESNASAGSLGCNITYYGGSITDKIYTWEFIGHDPPPDFDVLLDTGSLDYFGGEQYGTIGVFIAFLIFGAVVLGFSVINPVAGIVAGLVSLVTIYLLNLVYLDIAMLTGIGVLAVLAGWLMRN